MKTFTHKLTQVIVTLLLPLGILAQGNHTIVDDSKRRGVDAVKVEWDQTQLPVDAQGNIYFTLELPYDFTCFGLGWDAPAGLNPSDFKITYRAKKPAEPWSEWLSVEGDFTPDETPTNLYWTDALFTHDASEHRDIEVQMTLPSGVQISYLRFEAFNGNEGLDDHNLPEKKDEPENEEDSNRGSRNCPSFPSHLKRNQWCGGSAPCSAVLAGYSVTYINVGHVTVHHGASPNTYSSGLAVVRSYWNYHRNTLGWADIGYNYLFDKFGEMYQGRHNPNFPTSDVRGSHAGAANSSAIGTNFLGNADVTIATTAQMNKHEAFLCWWFDHRGFDPTTSAGMQTQAYGWQTRPRIHGHRDINPTFCPGNDLTSKMSGIRTRTLSCMNGCSGPNDPPNPTASTNTCGNKTLTRATPPSGVTYFWQGTSCGTSTANSSLTYTATASGTYYLRARDSNGNWSSGCGSVTVTVNPRPSTPPTPTVSTNNCGNKTLTRATPPSGVTYFWQGTSCGTSTANSSLNYTVSTSGTYYLRARSSAGCWSTSCSSVNVTVNPYPPAPPAPTSSNNLCDDKVLTRATPPVGQTYYWQGTSCGTSTATSALTYTVSTSGTYYLRARTSAGCWSQSCSSVSVVVNPLPPTPPSPTATTNGCGPITLTSINPPPGEIYYWQGTGCDSLTANPSLTYTATSSGMYYIRSLDTIGCWSLCDSTDLTIVDCPTNLSAVFAGCQPGGEVDFNWNNTGANWEVEVSLDQGFTPLHSAPASNVSTITGPQNFSPFLFIQPHATWYWRIAATGNIPGGTTTYINGQPFSIPFCDETPPTTQVDTIPGWQTASFSASFTDADNDTIGERFYNVLYFDGTDWKANAARGFFNDYFDHDSLLAVWTDYSGNWSNATGLLAQLDDADTNANISAPLVQGQSDRYLYHWKFRVNGNSINRKAGIHFFADSASLPNRGNSYLFMVDVDNNELQFYKVTNDVKVLRKTRNHSFAPGEYYDFKLTYDRVSGKMDVYINNVLRESWRDANPFSSGDYVSFRTEEASMDLNFLRVFRSRGQSVMVDVGSGIANDIRYENAAPPLSSGKVQSVVSDYEGNLSTLSSVAVDVDWTPPSVVPFVNDGPGDDIDRTYVDSELKANWGAAADTNSGIARYHYSIGTAPGATDVLGWTNNFLNQLVVNHTIPLVLNQMYYFNVMAENGAGLMSTMVSSDGQMIVLNNTSVEDLSNPFYNLGVYPNPFNNSATVAYYLVQPEKVRISLIDVLGREIAVLADENQEIGEYKIEINGSNLGLAYGMYMVVFNTSTSTTYSKLIFQSR